MRGGGALFQDFAKFVSIPENKAGGEILFYRAPSWFQNMEIMLYPENYREIIQRFRCIQVIFVQ